jgi:hypothetical protein
VAPIIGVPYGEDRMEPDIQELKALMHRTEQAGEDPKARVARRVARSGAEGRALELAVAAIEVLRDRGSISGADICRLAEFLGYDADATLRAWQTRGEFDLETTRYAIDAPIAKVMPLQ